MQPEGLLGANALTHEHNETVVAHTAVAKMEKISLWQIGKEKVIEMDTKLANNLISTLENVNLQGTCAIFEEDVEKLKQEGRIIEITFREPINVTISQWIKPEDRNHIPINASGYRILTNVEKAVFVLKGDYEGNILTKSADVKGYGCWAISKDGEIDKNWISEVEKEVEK
ncbi:MAG: hypothetical protein OD814_000271 [Candidatus Alkanophagales archaeon MCA70_species_1]|nr:hypothetical protein [Candidatus Alkanophaga volatiphilum]